MLSRYPVFYYMDIPPPLHATPMHTFGKTLMYTKTFKNKFIVKGFFNKINYTL